jgi:bifunctional UDP-N-acetylglucosamine pyrophosphorylase / glucosamine-1-phosphate N-acetyltransferase
LKVSTVILAAGQGTRMKSDLPKVLHPLAGRPMIRYVVDIALALEPASVVVVVGHGVEQVWKVVGEGVAYALQAEQLGTGHAVLQAAEAAAGQGDTVLVLFGDTPLVRPGTLRKLLEHHAAATTVATLLSFQPDDPTGYGRIVRDPGTGQVLAIVEEKEATPEEKAIGEASSGIYCFRDEWLWPNLARLERRPGGEVYLTDLVDVARRQGEGVAAMPASDALEVIGLDNRLKLARAEAEMRRRINEGWMLAGVTLVHPESTYIEADVEIGIDTTIWPSTYLRGRTRIGPGCTLGPGSVIVDSSLGEGCRVELSVVEQATMERDSNVGPFGHLRRGAHLGEGAHMGNFGEIKNAYLGPGAKMGHMSYLGDATVGAGANIGAGTITCNYDGQRKHRTVIGAAAFIGSDTMLVAPVTIGEGAKTGAGSVVTRDVPPGAMAYGVPATIRGELTPEGALPSLAEGHSGPDEVEGK